MDLDLTLILKSVIASSPLAAVLLAAVIVLWRENKALSSCADPSNIDPKAETCNRCLACKDRVMAARDTLFDAALRHLAAQHLEALKATEAAHHDEVADERLRVDGLQAKNEATLREIISIFKKEST